MRIMKRTLAMLLSASMLMAMTACGEKKTTESAKPSEAPVESTAPAESAAPAESEAPAEVNWPKSVEIVIPGNPGGDTDFNARQFAERLTAKTGVNFVITNMAGGGGATASRDVKDAAPDGSKILCYHSAFVVNELTGTTDYGLEAYDFANICALNPGNVITVNSSLGIDTMQELFDYTAAHPGELKIAAQVGATTYAVSSLLKQNGLDVTIVDAGTSTERLAALLGGHVDIILTAYGSIKDYIATGELVALAADSAKGIHTGDVEVSGLKELGYDIELPFYYFFAFPKGTDQAMIDQFNGWVQEIVEEDADYADTIATAYYQVPTFYGREEGLAKFDEVKSILESVDLG